MKTDNNFVRSGHERIANDNYQTVDHRCVQAFVETMNGRYFSGEEIVTDVCSPTGSGILDYFEGTNTTVNTCSDAFAAIPKTTWIITNPPYERNIVDKIILRQLERLRYGVVYGFAALLRTGFDHAKTRKIMFKDETMYLGQIKMLFRPVWFVDTDTTPIHNYVWHIWLADLNGYQHHPELYYW